MKLRIQGHSVRIRLKQSEMTLFGDEGRVEDRVDLGPSSALVYVIETRTGAEAVTLTFDGGRIVVTLPTVVAEAWVGTDQVGVEAEIPTSKGHLRLLLEKDFQCLHREPTGDVGDYFPHPEA